MYKRKSRHVRVTIFAVESNKHYYSKCLCSLSYPACKALTIYCIVICSLSGSTIFSPHDLIKGSTFGGKKLLKYVCVQMLSKGFSFQEEFS